MKTYASEEEFLKAYDPNQFERLSVTTDILILSVSSEESTNYRKTDKKHMSVLLVKRNDYPFKDQWCLPGGFLDIKEDLEDCPKRILERETNIKDVYLEQLYTFGSINRDPRMRIVSTSYMALIDKNMLLNKLNENAAWFDIKVIETVDDTLIFKLENENDKIDFKTMIMLAIATSIDALIVGVTFAILKKYSLYSRISILSIDFEVVLE